MILKLAKVALLSQLGGFFTPSTAVLMKNDPACSGPGCENQQKPQQRKHLRRQKKQAKQTNEVNTTMATIRTITHGSTFRMLMLCLVCGWVVCIAATYVLGCKFNAGNGYDVTSWWSTEKGEEPNLAQRLTLGLSGVFVK